MHEASELEYAGFWPRTGATLIDSILGELITMPILMGIYGTTYLTNYFVSEKMVEGPWDFLISYVLPAIAVILFWVYKAATPGKMAIKAKIVDANTGGPASTGQLIGRYFAYLVSFIPLGLGFFWICFDKKKQGWHDKLAGTVVVKPKNNGPAPVSFSQ